MLVNAQNLTISELVNLKNKNLVDAEEYLSSKKWVLTQTGKKDFQNSLLFKLGIGKNDNRFSESILIFSVSPKRENLIEISINSIEKYNSYISEVKKMGLKLKSSNIEDGNLSKTYKSKTNYFIFYQTTSTNSNFQKVKQWFLKIISIDDL